MWPFKKKKKSVYLCGSMSDLKGYGESWRKVVERWLDARGVESFNPCVMEKTWSTAFDIKEPAYKWDAMPQEFQEYTIKRDLCQIREHTSFIICYFTQYSTGTVSELTYAFELGIPIYVVTKRNIQKWPGTCVRATGNKVFKTWEELFRFLTLKYTLKKVKKKKKVRR